jgi:hypothetical protein
MVLRVCNLPLTDPDPLAFARPLSFTPRQPPSRHLLQGDPFTSFNEPAPPESVALGAPSFNLNGVGAVSNSATTVPVMGTLAAPLPVTGYAAGQAPSSVGAVSVRALGCLGAQRLTCGDRQSTSTAKR